MKKIIIPILLILVSLIAFPRKIRTNQSIPKRTESVAQIYEIEIEDTAAFLNDYIVCKKGEYMLCKHTIDMNKKVLSYELSSPYRTILLTEHPDSIRVYFTPKSPRYFHSFQNCSKLGDFRKLNAFYLADFLFKNKSACVCPQCAERNLILTECVQFILSE